MSKVEFTLPSYGYRELLSKKPEELAKEFEAILLKEVLKEAFRPLVAGKSFSTRMYYDAFLDGVSRELASAGGVGIAKYILDNLKEQT
ncbi:MAG: hypothetical protein GXN96_04575 [Aquificae bacterium]|nr:hypothetical protein [Aquificota bacterium]